ncbi:MAG TPA: hypothetical protein VHT96_09385 [Clostridia bacterium]|nr:hypothetical protein [Clostridia bacterium]
MGEVIITKTEYKGWKNCIEISNGIVDLIVTTDVGPRVIRYGFKGKENEFVEFEEHLGLTGGEDYRIYGGHRLWHSPEHPVRTYQPDNTKVGWRKKKYGVVLTQDAEPATLIRKEMEVLLDPEGTQVMLQHKLTNTGMWDVELSAWAISMMAAGGVGVIPLNARETGLLSNGSISLWPYTKMNDKRVHWGDKYILLSQSEKADSAFKIGLPNESGWAAYANHGHLFVLKFNHDIDMEYPDNNCSYETYTNARFMEMESLSPITLLDPGETVIHTENWSLYDNVEKPKNEKDIDEHIVPLLEKQPAV